MPKPLLRAPRHWKCWARRRSRSRSTNARDGFGYAVFGQVVSGMDVVDRIRGGATGPGDFPVDPVVIKHASLEK